MLVGGRGDAAYSPAVAQVMLGGETGPWRVADWWPNIPTSHIYQIPHVVSLVQRNPQGPDLYLGLEFAKYGFLIAKRLLVKCARQLNLATVDRMWASHSKFPERINLCLSLRCPANCVFCPDRAPQIHPKTMPMALIHKVLQEAADHAFKGSFSLSENGEALTHPQFLDIVREIRNRFPRNDIILFSNMILMDESRARALLDHGLTELHFNLDGATEPTYEYVKRHKKYSLVRHHIAQFGTLRNEMKSACRIHVYFITAKQFAEEIEGKEGLFGDDGQAIIHAMAPILRAGDTIQQLAIALHKYQSFLNHKKSELCDQFDRVLREIFIAPNGQTYICCFDFGNSSVLGNINENTIAEVWSSRLRERVVRNIYLMRYEESFDVCKSCPPVFWGPNADVYSILKRRLRKAMQGLPTATP